MVYLCFINNDKTKAMKIEIGTKVISSKNGNGTITRIITKSTGYVEVDFNGKVSKEMAFNLTNENGVSLKSKPVKKQITAEQEAKSKAAHARFKQSMNAAVLNDNFLPCQVATGSYNTNLIR